VFVQENGPLLLLPLNAQREKRFEEKFAKEASTTFWYQNEKNIVSLIICMLEVYLLYHTDIEDNFYFLSCVIFGFTGCGCETLYHQLKLEYNAY